MLHQRERGDGAEAGRRRVHDMDELASTARRTGGWLAHELPQTLSPQRLLRWVAKRAAFALVRRHLGIVAAALGTLVLVGTGGYVLGRRSR